MGESTLFQDEDEPQMRQAIRIVMPFALRPGFIAHFTLPDDLTKSEVERIAAMLMTIPRGEIDRPRS